MSHPLEAARDIAGDFLAAVAVAALAAAVYFVGALGPIRAVLDKLAH